MKTEDIIMMTDSYKVGHYPQYPPRTNKVFSFFESRGGRYPDALFFGLQYLIKKYFVGQVVTREAIDEADEIFAQHFGNPVLFNRQGWEYILNEYGGRLPISIRAVDEGSVIPVSNVLVTVENTDPRLYWLTNYVETLLVQLWYPITVATQSYYMKKEILQYLEKTGDPAGIDFKLHDFGYRGSTTVESAGIGGLAHLVNFKGTDTLEAIMFARKYYHEKMAGFSIPASEHSTITSWGRNGEVDAYENMLTQYPHGPVAVVSDSFDIFKACDEMWGGKLKDKVLNRDGVLVIRPDSGDPLIVLPKIMQILGKRFGYTQNEKGYKVLCPKVRVIQGDGIDHESVGLILGALCENGWSADNIVFGSGGGLLQKINRDTQKFAFKCSAVEIDGEWQDVIKDPVTDQGKRSKAGRIGLSLNNGKYQTAINIKPEDNLLREVFKNGELLAEHTLEEIRMRAKNS